jgi:hypothetical protein
LTVEVCDAKRKLPAERHGELLAKAVEISPTRRGWPRSRRAASRPDGADHDRRPWRAEGDLRRADEIKHIAPAHVAFELGVADSTP